MNLRITPIFNYEELETLYRLRETELDALRQSYQRLSTEAVLLALLHERELRRRMGSAAIENNKILLYMEQTL
jgi:hypothetical protein